jgi:hypothetical protein
MGAYRCMGSQERDVTHFVCPFKASPIGLPVFGSHKRTCGPGQFKIPPDQIEKKGETHMSIVAAGRQLSLHGLPLDT